ncbi:MAG: cytochrome b/b6 domain-containing protein [Deltaproteobacteria bacterium]|nr:cytochrome b/b6 domain-containing protein [Deltaproteobacteria bacterium]
MNARWGKWSVVLHWASAALIVGLAAAGFVMTSDAPDSSLRLLLSRLHTAFGISLMVATVGRLLARLRTRKPEPLPMAPLHRRGVALVRRGPTSRWR